MNTEETKKEDDDWQKIDEVHLLREIDELKTMIIKLHEVISIQNETIERMGTDMESLNKTLKRLNTDISNMKNINTSGERISYLKDYLVPLCSVINSMSPVVMMFGVRNILKWL